MNQKVTVIGCGASGLMAAITAARYGASVTVLEQNAKPGKKILSTGNGKCNLTNLDQQPEYYRSSTIGFPKTALEAFSLEDTIAFFHEIGIYTKNKNGYLYPYSEQASSVVELLLMEAKRLKVKIKLSECVTKIERAEDENGFIVFTKTWQYPSDRVIISCGSSASMIEGSDGSGYELAKSLGHSIVNPLPALTGLKAQGNAFAKWAGVRVEGVVTVQYDGCSSITSRGEIQLTEYGISGIPVFQISRYVSRALDEGKKVQVYLDFLPDFTMESCEAFFQSRIVLRPDKNLKEQLIGIFPLKLIDVLCGSKKASKLTLEEILTQMKHYKLNIKSTLDLDHAQVCTGGVSCDEIDPETMESKLVPGIYFSGEVADVDGTCGGYNLQWAWSSGYTAGRSAALIDGDDL